MKVSNEKKIAKKINLLNIFSSATKVRIDNIEKIPFNEQTKEELLECMTVGCYPYSPAELVDVEISGKKIEVRTPSSINRALNLSIQEWIRIKQIIEKNISNETFNNEILNAILTKIDKIIPSFQFKDFSSVKDLLTNAISSKNVLEFTYQKRSKNPEIRKVLPIFLFEESSHYLAGLCLHSNSIRSFRLDGILSIKMTDQTLDFPIENFSKEEFLKNFNNFKKERASDSIEAELLVHKTAYYNLSRTIFLSKIGSTDGVKKDFIKVKTKIIEENWFLELIKGYGSSIEIISPGDIRVKYLGNLESIVIPELLQ